MSSTTSVPRASERDDGLLDFLVSHHGREERGSRCFLIGGRSVCARCLGWMAGTAASVILLAHGTAFPFQLACFFPAPAFLDWGGRKLGFFRSGKLMAAGTGLIMGIAVPYFMAGAAALDGTAVAGAAAYVALFAAITAYARR